MKKNILRESLGDLKNFKKILSEAYGEGIPQEAPQQQAMPQGGMEQGQMEEMPQEGEMNDPEMSGIIDKIRQLAIQGIAKYADQVESSSYQNLKKIWIMTDKVYEDAFGDNNKKK